MNVGMWEILIFHMSIFFSKKIAGAKIKPLNDRDNSFQIVYKLDTIHV